MTSYAKVRFGRMSVPWRRLEWWGAACALYLQTGATAGLPLKILIPPAFAITVALVANNADAVLTAVRRTPLLVWLLFLPFLSLTWSIAGALSLRRAVALTLSMALAYVISVRFTPRQLLVLTAVVLVPGLVASLVLLAVSPSRAMMPDGTIAGVFGHKNLLGWHAAVALVAGCLATARGDVRRPVGIGIMAIATACLAVSGSATALLSVFVAALLASAYALARRLDQPSRLFLLLVLVQLTIAACIIGSTYVAPALEAMGKDTSLTGRAPMWRLADRAIAERPVLGYGYQAFWSDGSGYGWRIRSEINWDTPNTHNGYREILLAFGVVGLVPFLVLLVRTLLKGAHLDRLAPHEGWLWLNVFVGMMLVMNWTESIFYMPYSFLFIYFITAVLMIALADGQRKSRKGDVLEVP